ncbi:helix-turn-helix domain-containing protein [Hyphobacterium marinum]|uniref:AraC family transcriptional regulator n=1 Tax=Hyphobacterium marinum TaxID=3116574 RepID=A0ABU7LUH8_9PROT|nr:AraC family transcriptional regulator [Hyphobacterium sp. Y6023]MEE2565141.1 AraC family transcriptional regulator [Hyphobacterium sp. Y6023]
MTRLHDIVPGHDRLAPRASLTRHRHVRAYAAVVLEGGYTETGDGGRIRAAAGDIIVHGVFDAHADRVGKTGARTCNLPLAGSQAAGVFRAADPDDFIRIAHEGPSAATGWLARHALPRARDREDWPDLLLAAMDAEPDLRFDRWAEATGLRPETVSRGFASVYGITPARLRLERRAKAAWRAIVSTRDPLSAIALDTGFADQPHMSRAVREVTGHTPGAWRKAMV